MGDKDKHNGEAEDTPAKDEDVGAEGDDTTDDEGGVDTPPPQKEEEEEDAANDDGTFEVEQIVDMECQRRWKCPVKFRVRWAGYSEKDDTWLPASELSCEDLINDFLEISGRSSEYKNAMVPKKRAAVSDEATMQTRKAARFSYSELDEDQDEVIPAGTRTRKPKTFTEPKVPKASPKKKRVVSKVVPRGKSRKEPQEFEVEKILDERENRDKKEYLVQWKNLSPKHNTWEPEENLVDCKEALRNFFASLKKIKPGKVGRKVKKVEEPEEEEVKEETKAKVKPVKGGRRSASGKAKKVVEPEEEDLKQVMKPEAEELRGRSRRAGKNRSYSEFYNQ